MKYAKLILAYIICVIGCFTSLWIFNIRGYVGNYRFTVLTNDAYHDVIPASDASILMTLNMRRMVYILNGTRVCGKNKVLSLVAVIISSPEHTQMRLDLRDSWTRPLSASNSTAVIFFTGRAKNESVDESVILENDIYHDLVVVDFDESYRNLSLKTILMLRWVRDFCPNAKFVLKSDDDMFINVYNLMSFIREDEPNTRSIYGYTESNYFPQRNPDSKWVVTKKEYNETVYPDFVLGPSYLVGIDAVSVLVERCVRLPYLYLEDVFVTGICAEKANVSRLANRDFINDKLPSKCKFYSAISGHQVYGKKLKTNHRKASDFTAYRKCRARIPKVF